MAKGTCPFEPAKGKFIAEEVTVDKKDGIVLPDSLKQKRMVVLESGIDEVKVGDHLVIDAPKAFQVIEGGKTYWIFGQGDYCAKWKQ